MLTVDEINDNANEFLKLLAEIDIPGADVDGLVENLKSSKFFTAPASTVYHSNFTGGLCLHSLNVYHNLVAIYNLMREQSPETVPEYDKNSLLIVGLLHDLAKADFYEIYTVNKKIYDDNGSKKDNLGKFDWVSEEAFKVVDSHNRFVAGTHGFNSMLLISKYIPLTLEENIAVYNHHCGMDDKNATNDLSAIMNKYPLLTLLHLADLSATYLNERM